MKIIRYKILDTIVDHINTQNILELVDKYVKNKSNPIGFILAMGPEKAIKLRNNSVLQNFFKKATIVIPDGIGIAKALKFLYDVKVSRIAGADLMQDICREAPSHDWKVFVYGASEAVNAQASETLKKRYPGIQIAGRANGFIPHNQMEELVDRINDSEADILFIALGSPRQEEWMATYAERLTTVKLCQGIGGTLDTIAGTVKRAPLFWQRLGLEWFYRLMRQPGRFKRYLIIPIFIRDVIIAKLKRSIDLEERDVL